MIEKKKLKDLLLKQQCQFEEQNLISEEKYENLLKNWKISQKREDELKALIQDRECCLVDQIEENEQIKAKYQFEKDNLVKKIKDLKEENTKLIDDVGLLRDELRDKEKLKKDLTRAVALNNKLLPCNSDFERDIFRLQSDVKLLVKEKKDMIDSVRKIVYQSSHINELEMSYESIFDNDLMNISKKKKGCLIPGCNGNGHINGKSASHKK